LFTEAYISRYRREVDHSPASGAEM